MATPSPPYTSPAPPIASCSLQQPIKKLNVYAAIYSTCHSYTLLIARTTHVHRCFCRPRFCS